MYVILDQEIPLNNYNSYENVLLGLATYQIVGPLYIVYSQWYYYRLLYDALKRTLYI